MVTSQAALTVRDLVVDTGAGSAALLDGVTFTLEAGARLALLGASGSGKSTLALALMRLLRPPARSASGEILLGDTPLTSLSDAAMRACRGSGIFSIFQSPGSVLDPLARVGSTLETACRRRLGQGDPEAIRAALELVQLPSDTVRRYPFELSGGMRQRVLIAAAVLLRPQVLIADEPTTGLDSLTQAEVLRTLSDMVATTNGALLLITHDLRAASVLCRDALVIEAGRLVDRAPIAGLLEGSRAPATRTLARAALALSR